MIEFKLLYANEGVHTLEGGVVRRKRRKSRRPGLKREPPLLFYPRFAIESAGKAQQISVVTVDGSPDGIAAVQAGRLVSTSAQFPREIGRIAAEKAYDHLAGKPVEKEVKVEVKLITREEAGKSAASRETTVRE